MSEPTDTRSDPVNPSTTAPSPAPSDLFHRLQPPPGWTPPGHRRRSYRALGEVAPGLRATIAAARLQWLQERAAWVGDCFDCRDTGDLGGGHPCPHCARGRLLAEAQAVTSREEALLALLRHVLTPRTRDFTLDTFPDQAHPALASVRAFLAGWDGTRGLLLMGHYGTGKTGLLIGALRAVAEQWAGPRVPARSIRLVDAPALFSTLRGGFDDGGYLRTLERHQRVSLLALDDLGAEKPSEWVREQSYAIVNYRYEHQLPIWGTSNLALPALADRLGERTVWRLSETCTVIDVVGPNWRQVRA